MVYPPFFGVSDHACPVLACPALRLTDGYFASNGLAGHLVVYPPFFGLSDRVCPALACPALRLTGGRSATNAMPGRPSSGLSLVVYPPSLVYPTAPVYHFACPVSILLSCGVSDLFGLCDLRLPCIVLVQRPASCAAPHLVSGCGWVGPDFPVSSFICSMVLSTRRVDALPWCFLFLLVWFFFCQIFFLDVL